jgi:hypothetical protein
MTRMSEAFPSKFLKAADLQGQHVTVTIDRVEVEDIDGKGTHKPVVYFQGKVKGIVLNKTNATTISDAYGDESDDWAGKPLLLYDTKTPFEGKLVDALRVKIPRRAPGSAAVTKPQTIAPAGHARMHTEVDPPPHTEAPVEIDDSIPF